MNHKALKPIVYLMAAACLTTSCIGSFGLFNKVLDWNKRATGNKFLNALIFILISPAYALCGVADIFVINTIEFWSGSNPLAENVGKTESVLGSDGKLYAVTTLEDGYEVKGPDGPCSRSRTTTPPKSTSTTAARWTFPSTNTASTRHAWPSTAAHTSPSGKTATGRPAGTQLRRACHTRPFAARKAAKRSIKGRLLQARLPRVVTP